jgi:hypothetical protein
MFPSKNDPGGLGGVSFLAGIANSLIVGRLSLIVRRKSTQTF